MVALLVSPAEFLSVTVTRTRMLRLGFRIRKLFFDSLSLSVTRPLPGTVKRFLTRVTFPL